MCAVKVGNPLKIDDYPFVCTKIVAKPKDTSHEYEHEHKRRSRIEKSYECSVVVVVFIIIRSVQSMRSQKKAKLSGRKKSRKYVCLIEPHYTTDGWCVFINHFVAFYFH